MKLKMELRKGRNWKIQRTKDMENWLFNFKRNKKFSCFVPKKNQGKWMKKLKSRKGYILAH